MMTEVHLITAGEYLDERTIAVAETAEAGQAWADRWNLDNLDHIASAADKAVVGAKVPFIPAGGR
jgi:hypothetical protein